MQPIRILLAALAVTAAAAAPALAQPSPQDGGALIDEGGSGEHLDEGGTAPGDLPLDFAKPQSETEVRALLESQGYSDIRDIRMEGEVITANAMRDGERQEVVIRLKTESQDGG